MGFDTPFDGIRYQNQFPSESRMGFSVSSNAGFASTGNCFRNPHMSTDNNPSKGIGFGEAFQFHKVFQGQEVYSSSTCQRAQATNDANKHGGWGTFDGVHGPSSRSGWSSLMQRNNGHIHSSAQSVQASSPSSVFMFQQAINPISNFNSANTCLNQGERRAEGKLIHVSESNNGKLASSFHGSFNVGDPGDEESFPILADQNQHDISSPLTTQSTLRSTKKVVSSCKSSCRLFGFSLTDEKHLQNKGDRTIPVASSLNPGVSIFPNVGGQFHSSPPLMSSVIENNYTKARDFYAVRDLLFYS